MSPHFSVLLLCLQPLVSEILGAIWDFSQFSHPASRLWWLKTLIPLGDPLGLHVQVSVFGSWWGAWVDVFETSLPHSFHSKKPRASLIDVYPIACAPTTSYRWLLCNGEEDTGALGRLFLSSPSVSQLLTHYSQVVAEAVWGNVGVWVQTCSVVGILAIPIWLSPHVNVKSLSIFTLSSSVLDSSSVCSFASDKLSCGSYISCKGFATFWN